MTKASEEISQQAIQLIEEQLQVLPLSIAMILQPGESSGAGTGPINTVVQLKRKPKPEKTGSVGNIVVDNAQADATMDFKDTHEALQRDPLKRSSYLRVVIGNALLAVDVFLKEHNMSTMRTPEIQFLEHVIDAILNQNRFKLEQGYMPIATFDGLVIDSSLDGQLLFGDGVSEGFMEPGDAIALLQWLALYLRGEKNFVTGGDAG